MTLAVPAEVMQKAPVVGLSDQEPTSIYAMLDKAIDRGMSVESIQKLGEMVEKFEARRAEQLFADAMMEFQSSCPPIRKTSSAQITTKGGGRYGYQYAELDEIARTVNPLLHARGLSYAWNSKGSTDKVLTCVCTVRHTGGHSATASFSIPVENASAMSDQQKHAAALTYARRQSLIQALGLTTTDPDTDGAVSGAMLTEDQQTFIADQVKEHGLNKDRLFKYLGVGSLGEVPASMYTATLNVVESLKRAKQKGGVS